MSLVLIMIMVKYRDFFLHNAGTVIAKGVPFADASSLPNESYWDGALGNVEGETS